MSDLNHREALALLSQTINATTSLMKEKGASMCSHNAPVADSNSVTFVVPPRSVNPGGAVVPYGDPKQPNEDPSAKGCYPGAIASKGREARKRI